VEFLQSLHHLEKQTIMKKLLLPIFIVLLFTAFKASKDSSRIITGTVTEKATGAPLVGVSVQSLPDGKRTVTNKQGKYSISLAIQAKELSFSFIGFEQKKLKINGPVMDVVLNEDKRNLNEIVVVGSKARQKRESLTGSVAYAPSALQSRVAGLQVAQADQAAMIWSPAPNEESYASINENQFRNAIKTHFQHSLLMLMPHPIPTYVDSLTTGDYLLLMQ